MPNTSDIQPFNATCGGGLVLNKDVYDMQPGEALQLINFEPSTEGGYRILQLFHKYHLLQKEYKCQQYLMIK